MISIEWLLLGLALGATPNDRLLDRQAPDSKELQFQRIFLTESAPTSHSGSASLSAFLSRTGLFRFTAQWWVANPTVWGTDFEKELFFVLMEKDPETLYRHLEQRVHPAPWMLSVVAQWLFQSERLFEAASLAQKIPTDLRNFSDNLLISVSYLKLGLLPRAELALLHLPERSRLDILITDAFQRRDWQKVLSLSRSYRYLQDPNEKILELIGYAHLFQKNYKMSAAFFKSALKVSPNDSKLLEIFEMVNQCDQGEIECRL